MKKIILFISLISAYLLAQTNQTDYGELFIRAINSTSETKQKEIISKIFSQSAISEVGIDRLLGLVKQLHDSYAPIEFHHSETLNV